MASLRKLRKATKQFPTDPTAWYQLGLAALEAGEVSEGEQALRAALELKPPPEVTLPLAEVFQKRGQRHEALLAFRMAAAQTPESGPAHTGLGLSLIAAGDPSGGLEHLRRAAELLPGNADAQYLLVGPLLAAGDREEAKRYLLQTIDIDPEHQAALTLLGRCRREDGEFEEGRQLLEQALRLNPMNFGARVDLGFIQAKTGDAVGGYRCFREVAEGSGSSPPLLARIAQATHELGDLTSAIRYLREAVRLQPDLVEARTQLGLCLLEEGSAGAAAVELARAAELAPGSFLTLYNLGLAYQGQGDLEKAERAYAEAAGLAPGDEELQARLHEVRAARAAREAEPSVTRPPVGVSSAAMVGSLDDFGLPELLQLLKAARRSGVLYLSAGDVSGEVSMLEGAITSASSPSASLGDILVLEHGINGDQLRQVLGLQREGSPQRIGALLVQQGLLDEERLATAVGRQIEAAVAEMLGWNHGRFAFEPQRSQETVEAPATRIDVDRLLMDIFSSQAEGEADQLDDQLED